MIEDNDPQARSLDGSLKFHPDGRPVLPGQDHARAVCNSLVGTAKRVRLLSIPNLPLKGDVSDWLAAGGTAEALHDLMATGALDFENADSDQTVYAELAVPSRSEESLALKFAARHSQDLRYVAAWSRWIVWDGCCWKRDDRLRAFDLARAICREAAAESEGRDAVVLASAKTVSAVERLARSDTRLAATVSQWDADPWLLNTPGGMIDLRSGVLRPHSAADFQTKITAVAADPKCPTPLWTRFLATTTGGDASFAAFLNRMADYALTGDTREHALFFLCGAGANGKSTFLNTRARCAGEYATSAPIETFTASNVERHPTELADLRGARIVTATETEEGRRWAESRIKMLTGGDKVKARRMRQDFFEYKPQFKLIVSGNHKPGLRSVDEAMRRRFNLVPFTATVPTRDRDLALGERLKNEWPGILAWMVEGTAKWLEAGLAPPPVVADATAAYMQSEDALAAWIEECCEYAPEAWTPTSLLFENWSAWAEKNREYPGRHERFPDLLEQRGIQPLRKANGRGFVGLQLRQTQLL